MKLKFILGWSSALCLSAMMAQAQETNQPADFDQRLKQMQEAFEKRQQEMEKKFEDKIAAQDTVIESLKQQLAGKPTNRPPAVATITPGGSVPATPSGQPSPATELTKPWSPADPIRVAGSGQNYMNISFDALVTGGGSTAKDIEQLETGDHDPKQNGFTVQNLELTLDGKIDPYFRGQGNIVLKIDPRGETTIEAEEAYLETMSLPWNLQVKAGQFFTEFGRLNATHPHTWSFVDQPLINGRVFGPEGLRSAGARVSWLMPTPFYSELFFTIQNSQGGTAYSFRNDNDGSPLFGRMTTQGRVANLGDMLFTPRYAASFDLTDNQTLVAGTSAAFGPNGSGKNTDTQIYGVDLFWKWKSPNAHGGFPFVSWQTEAMLRRYQADPYSNAGHDTDSSGTINNGETDFFGDGLIHNVPRETLTDWGMYSQILYGIKNGWIAGLRGDFVTGDRAKYEKLYGDDPERGTRWRISPDLTWYPSEFSKLRFQYNFDYRDGLGPDHSIWLQFEFLLGAHAAHKF